MKKINLSVWHLLLLVVIAVALTAGVVYTVIGYQVKKAEYKQFSYFEDFSFEYKKGWHLYEDERGILLSPEPIVAVADSIVLVPIQFGVEPRYAKKTLSQIVKDYGDSVVSSEDTTIIGLPAKKISVFSEMVGGKYVEYVFKKGDYTYYITISEETPETQHFLNSMRIK